MKYLVVLLIAVAASAHRGYYSREKQGPPPMGGKGFDEKNKAFFEKLMVGVEAGWNEVYATYLEGNTGCSKQDLELLHAAHGKNKPDIKIPEYEDYELTWSDVEQGLGIEEDIDNVMDELKEHWDDIQEMVGLSEECTVDEVGKAFVIMFDNRKDVCQIFRAAVSEELGEKAAKFEKAMIQSMKDLMAKLKEKIFGGLSCTKKDLYHIGKAVMTFVESVPEEFLEDMHEHVQEHGVDDEMKAEISEHLQKLKDLLGISCDVEEIHEVIHKLFSNHKKIEHIYHATVTKALAENARLRRRGYYTERSDMDREELVMRAIAGASGKRVRDSYWAGHNVFRRMFQ